MVDRARRQEQPRGYLGIAKPLRDELQNLRLAERQIGDAAACRGAWSTRQATKSPLAHPVGNQGRRRRGPEDPQLVESPPQRRLTVAVGERQRSLIWAAEPPPRLGGKLPLTCDLE